MLQGSVRRLVQKAFGTRCPSATPLATARCNAVTARAFVSVMPTVKTSPSKPEKKSLAGSVKKPEHHRATHTKTRATQAEGAMTKRVLVPVANGSEEMEAVITIDVLRRAGAEVIVASVEPHLEVKCSRGVVLKADMLIGEAAKMSYDLIALPGGMPGAERLRDCAVLEDLVKKQQAADKWYAAICATPAVFFEAKGIINGKNATAHPAFSNDLKNQSAVSQRVVVDGKLVTSRGPGTAFEFSLELVKLLYGAEKMKSVAGPMVMPAHH